MIGIVDIGSNTIRLSCYEIAEDNKFCCIIHKKEVAGLAGYIDDSGNMTNEGIEKTIKVIEKFKQITQYMELSQVYYFATAAIRNTRNCQDIVSKIQERTGYEIEVLSGKEEAICDFVGVSEDAEIQNGKVIDIGGGSTEIVSFEERTISDAVSYGIGSLNMYKKHVKNILPDKTELSNIRKEVKECIDEEKNDTKVKAAYGVGGSIRAILRLYNREYHLDEENRDMEGEKIRKLLKLYEENKRYMVDRIIKTAPERLHTIIPGLTILCTILKQYEISVVRVSKYGVREGYLMRHILK